MSLDRTKFAIHDVSLQICQKYTIGFDGFVPMTYGTGGGDDQPPQVVLSEGVHTPVMPASKPKPNGIARYQKPSVSLSPCVASFMFRVSDPDRLSPPAQVCMCRLNGTSNIVFLCEIASMMRVVITYKHFPNHWLHPYSQPSLFLISV